MGLHSCEPLFAHLLTRNELRFLFIRVDGSLYAFFRVLGFVLNRLIHVLTLNPKKANHANRKT